MIIDKKGRLFNLINIVDLLIIVMIIVIGSFAYTKFIAKDKKSELPQETITYEMELTANAKHFAEAIHEGDKIKESIKGNNLGEITGKTVKPSTVINMDIQNGKFVKAEIPDKYDVILTVKAPAKVNNNAIYVDNVEFKVGKKIFIKGKGYAGTALVLSIKENK